ncbi:hypothetical protein AGDE_12701 [Angomonas deanei]|uniref:Methyltransferase n=1 Tax=Angomonas deanei TaxID=59799 RepID=A0A7G2CAQ1_9TRYP|nr:hypothetical protein AGDE_12701 [Angomonas deanei]CAD2215102.1 hypothetical protein, conserved [Angomonas deanei]|eukprot:EPY23979.1 hypothetical protein AGDE_12701 [Angomonas deanei]
MNHAFETPEETTQWTTELLPIKTYHTALKREEKGATTVKEVKVGIAFRRCEALRQVQVLETGGQGDSGMVDRTGLFLWRGTREFIQLFESFCKAFSEKRNSSSSEVPFEVAVELGAGSGLGTLVVSACSACFLESNVIRCIATDYWLTPLLNLLMPSKEATVEHLLSDSTGEHDAVHCKGDDEVYLKQKIARQMNAIAVEELDWISCMQQSGTEEDGKAVEPLSFLSRYSPNANCKVWFYGLDIIYPDTREVVLLSLLACVRRGLTMHSSHHRGNLFTQTFLTTYVERDNGETLFHIVLACLVMGLEILPLASPFHEKENLSAALPLLLTYGTQSVDGNAEALRDDVWHSMQRAIFSLVEHVETNGNQNRLQDIVAKRGSWLLALRVIDPTEKGNLNRYDLESCLALLNEYKQDERGVKDKIGKSAYWSPLYRLMPWILNFQFYNKKDNYALSTAECAKCAVKTNGEDGKEMLTLDREKMSKMRLCKQQEEEEKNNVLACGFDF